MRIGAGAGVTACLIGALASAVLATAAVGDSWKLKTVMSLPPGKSLVNYDFTFVDPVRGYYFLADRTNKAVDVFNTATNTFYMFAGVSLGKSVFKGNVPGGLSGPNGVMTVRNQEIWASDGDSTVKVLSMSTGGLLATISTGGQFRVDGICYASLPAGNPNIGVAFAVNNRDSPPYMTAISVRYRTILGKIYFNGVSQPGGIGTPPQAVSIEQCRQNPRDGKLYVVLPEICNPPQAGGICPGLPNPAQGAVVTIDPKTLTVSLFFTVPTCSQLATGSPSLPKCDPTVAASLNPPICSAPAGIAIGPPFPSPQNTLGGGQIMLGCNGQAANADPTRMELIIADGQTCSQIPQPPYYTQQPPYICTSGGAAPGTLLATIPYESGADEIDYDPIKNKYTLPRGVNNSWNNAGAPPNNALPNPPVCPAVAGYTVPYGGTGLPYGANPNGIYVGLPPAQGASPLTPNTTGGNMAGPQVLGSVNASTGLPDDDVVTGVFNCPDTVSPNVANPHGTNGHVAVDPAHSQIYVPINSTSGISAFDPIHGTTTDYPSPNNNGKGICSTYGGNDAAGCIAVFAFGGP
jgi:hypothetical protein